MTSSHTNPTDVILHVTDNASDLERALSAASTLTETDSVLRVRIVVNGAALKAVTGPVITNLDLVERRGRDRAKNEPDLATGYGHVAAPPRWLPAQLATSFE